jgi:hypothetical protein
MGERINIMVDGHGVPLEEIYKTDDSFALEGEI